MDNTSFGVLLACTVLIFSLAFADIDVVEHGAVGDGSTDDVEGVLDLMLLKQKFKQPLKYAYWSTEAFLAAWSEACSDSGSPKIIVPEGMTFLLSPLTFQGPCQSPIHFQIDGKLLAPSKVWKENECDNWITFKSVQSLTIDGSGEIDGNGDIWWSCRANKKCGRAPNTMELDTCSDIKLSGLTFTNSPLKHLSIHKTNIATLTGLTIRAPEDSPNTDGVHIGESQHVQVLDSTIGTGDDCVSIGDGSSDVNITSIICGPGHGISIGSLGKNNREEAVEQVIVSSCDLIKTMNGVRIKTWQGGSGYARGIIFQDINFDMVKNPIIIDQFYCDRGGECPTKGSAVEVSDIQYIGARGSSANSVAINLNCSDSVSCTGIVMSNVNIQSAGGGEAEAFCNNAEGTKKEEVIPEVPCLNEMLYF